MQEGPHFIHAQRTTMSATFGGYTGGALPTPRGPSGGGGGGNSSRNGRGGRGSRGRNRDRDRDNRRNRNHNRRRSSGGRSWSRSRSRSRSRDREDSNDQEERERKWTREGSRSHRKTNKSGRQPQQQRQPVPSVEGWIVMITNVHKEAQEDDVREMFGEFGEIQNCHLNLDRKTGYCKGYALLEYEKKASADEAIEKCHKGELLGQTIGVEFAFVAPPGGGGGGGRGHGGRDSGGGRGSRVGHRRRY